MNSPETIQQLKALHSELQKLPALPWSNITNWAEKARSIISKAVPQHLPLFDRMTVEPTPNVLEIFPGGTREDFFQFAATAIARAKQTPEYQKACEAQKQALLFFVEAAVAS